MESIFVIIGSSYDGCNGWTNWQLENLFFTTYEKAEKYIEDNLQGRQSRYSVEERIIQ